jgi:hypothetical protein
MNPRGEVTALVCALMLCAAPAVATAQDPATTAYAEAGGNVLPPPPAAVAPPQAAATTQSTVPAPGSAVLGANVAGSSDPDQPPARRGVSAATAGDAPRSAPPAGTGDSLASLPFTGADAGVAGLAGLILLSLGLLLRRTAQPRPRHSRRLAA